MKTATKKAATVTQANTKEETTMNNTQLAHRLEATLSDGTKVHVSLETPISVFSKEELHEAINRITPPSKKHCTILRAVAYGSDNKPIALPTATVTEANTSKEDTNMNNNTTTENQSFFDKEFDAAVEDLEKAVEESVKDLKGAKAKQYIKDLINAEDKDVYHVLMSSINGAVHNSRIAMSTRRKLQDNFRKIDAKSFLILEGVDVSKKDAALAKLKLMITLIVRKTLALLEGTAFFVFDATSILGVMVTRIAYTTAREVTYASRSLISAFKGDILEYVKHA